MGVDDCIACALVCLCVCVFLHGCVRVCGSPPARQSLSRMRRTGGGRGVGWACESVCDDASVIVAFWCKHAC